MSPLFYFYFSLLDFFLAGKGGEVWRVYVDGHSLTHIFVVASLFNSFLFDCPFRLTSVRASSFSVDSYHSALRTMPRGPASLPVFPRLVVASRGGNSIPWRYLFLSSDSFSFWNSFAAIDQN